MSFCKDFVWGAATAAYQVEGAAFEGDKGLNIWDEFSHRDGKIYGNHNGDIACDHFHRFKADIAIMKELHITAYRFSINWSRVLPNGVGTVSQSGLRFYHELIDELLKNGIRPFITLYHWDLPYELYKRGGWLNGECVSWFAEYAELISKEFSGKVTDFITFNEPQCFVQLGYGNGFHAPGLQLSIHDTLQISHNILKAHGAAVRIMRENACQDIRIGFAPTAHMHYPATEKPEDIEAARIKIYELVNDPVKWVWNIQWWNDPIFFGSYPEEGLKLYRDYLPEITAEDMLLIAQPIDFLGENIYNGDAIYCGTEGEPKILPPSQGEPKTALNWPITPESIYWGPRFIYERYKAPIYITENGMSCHDVISLDGKVHDPNRIDFLERYLKQLKRCNDDHIDVRGYFQWSLLDNFEWHSGYQERFGLVFVDYQNQKRVIKDSGYWYRDLIDSKGTIL